jgi:zinc and cadmium transporter
MPVATIIWLMAYCLIVAAVSFGGGWLPSLIKLTHTRVQLMMSLVAGLMLGVGLWHLLPHGIGELQEVHPHSSVDEGVLWLSIGLIGMFFLIRAFHFHHHGPVEPDEGDEKGMHDKECQHDHGPDDHAHHAHGPACDHKHSHDHDDHGHDDSLVPKHPLAWVGLFFGLAVHTLIDGIALGASVAAEGRGEAAGFAPGLAVFLAIALHKPLDALSITSLMAAGGWSPQTRMYVNAGFALVCPLGTLLFFFGADSLGNMQHLCIGYALCFSAGVFLCISLGDLLPELHFHSHDQIPLSLMLLLGLALAYGIRYLEPGHLHNHGPPAIQGHDHPHEPGAVNREHRRPEVSAFLPSLMLGARCHMAGDASSQNLFPRLPSLRG